MGGSDACPLKRWLQWTQKVVLSLVDRFLKEGVPTGVAQLVRLQGPEVQPLREENRAMLQIQFSVALGEYERHTHQFPRLLVKQHQDLGRDWALGK